MASFNFNPIKIVEDIGTSITDTAGNVVDEANRASESIFDTNALNAYVNYLSGGLIGTDEGSDQLGVGATSRGADELVGEIGGRNAQRESLNRQTARFRAEEIEKNRLLSDERAQAEKDDINASRAASRLQNRGNRSGGGGQPFSLGSQRDFLGL